MTRIAEYGSAAWRRWKHDHHWVSGSRPSGPLVSDTFTRADGAIGTAETGQTWIDNGGSWQVSSGAAGCTVTAASIGAQSVLVDAGVADCTIQATVTRTGGAGAFFLAFRQSDASNLLAYYASGTNVARLFRVVAGVTNTDFTGTSHTAWAAGDVLRVVLSGSSCSFYQNGALIHTHTETFNQTVTKHGLGSNAPIGAGGALFDNFTVTVP